MVRRVSVVLAFALIWAAGAAAAPITEHATVAPAKTPPQATARTPPQATVAAKAKPRVAARRMALAPPPRPKPARKPDIEHQGVRLKAVLASDGPAVSEGLAWSIVPVAGGAPITSSLPAPAIELAPGSYRVEAAAGKARTTASLVVAADRIEEMTVDLAAGRLHLEAKPGADYMPLDRARFRLWRLADGGDGSVADTVSPFAAVAGGAADLVLPAGRYKVEAALGLVTSDKTVDIAPGAAEDLGFDLAVGFVGAEARAAEGTEPLQTATFSLFPLSADAAATSELGRRMGRHAVFAVAPGQYRLVARFGHAEAEQIVKVATNRLTPVALNLRAARLSVEVLGPRPDERADAAAQIRVSRLGADGAREPVADIVTSRPMLRLAAGRYEVEAARDGATDRQSVTLTPGDQASLRLVLDPGSVTVHIDTPSGLELDDPAIDLVAWPQGPPGKDGPPIGLGAPHDGPFRLPAGTYRIEATMTPGFARAQAEVVVAAGASETARLAFDLGRAELKLLQRDGGPPVASAAWRLESRSAPAPIRLGGGAIDLALAPGTYDLSAETGDSVTSGTLVVVSGETAHLSLVAK